MKIKNIIFDLGNVLISFNPEEYLIKKDYSRHIRETIMNDIFLSQEWKSLDNGDITTPEAIDSIALKSSLTRDEINVVFNFRSDIMFPLDQNARLLPGLKKQGFKLFYLSNFPLDTFEEISNGYFFFRHFDGGVISSEAKLTKPDLRIYELLLRQYSLRASESLFIDDLEVNVKAAISVGMNGLTTFGEPDISAMLAEALRRII
ncbi:MAG: HAD family phosphatase [Bacteroidales bacterium]